MATKTVDIEVSAIYSFTYDPESAEFKKALDHYRAAIDKGGTEENLVTKVLDDLRKVAGTTGRSASPVILYAGIVVENETPDYNYEFLEYANQ